MWLERSGRLDWVGVINSYLVVCFLLPDVAVRPHRRASLPIHSLASLAVRILNIGK